MSCRGLHRVSLTGVCCIPRYRLASILLLNCTHNDESLKCWLSIRQYSTEESRVNDPDTKTAEVLELEPKTEQSVLPEQNGFEHRAYYRLGCYKI